MHIVGGQIIPSEQNAVGAETATRLSEFKLRTGDVVLGRRGEMGRSACVTSREDGWLCGTGSLIVRPNDAVDARFLQRFFSSPAVVRALTNASVGSTMVNLNQGVLKNLAFRLPPLAEQKRIADKLDRMLAAVDTCKARIDSTSAILKRFRQSALAAATSGELTKEWRAAHGLQLAWRDVRLDEIAEVQGGITKDSKKQFVTDREVLYLRVANVQRGYLDLSEIKTIRVPEVKLPRLLLEPGDVLFTEGGDIDKLGRGWVWEGQFANCTYQNHIFRARLLDKRNQPKYISWWANHRGLAYFLGQGKQTTNLASINKSQLMALPISLPPPEEQAEIVSRVESLFALAEQLERRLRAAREQVECIAQSVLAQAFRGEFVLQSLDIKPQESPKTQLPTLGDCARPTSRRTA